MDVRLHPLEYTQRDLPNVCAVTGEPADWYMRTGATKALSPAYFLLLLLGPLGWLILLAVLTRGDGTYVDVPVSRRVYDDIQERRRRMRWLGGALVAEIVAFAFLAQGAPLPAAWVVFAPTIAAGIWVGSVPNHRIRLAIDAVGLVTMRKVHPNFAAAVAAWHRNAHVELS